MKEEWKDFTKNKYTVLFAGVIAGVLIMIPVVFFLVQNVYLKENKEISPGTTESGGKADLPDIQPSTSPTATSSPNPTPTATPHPSSEESSPTTSPKPKEEVKYAEEDVISYIAEQEQMISNYQGTEMNEGILSKLKSGFVSVVDFLFYGSSIHGYTFSQLSSTAKLKILKLASTIDHKIDQYFPGYKDTIKNGVTDLKAKAVGLYLTTTAKLCEVVGSDVCNQAREDFQNMKTYLKIDWNLIKGVVSQGTGALKEWYESIR